MQKELEQYSYSFFDSLPMSSLAVRVRSGSNDGISPNAFLRWIFSKGRRVSHIRRSVAGNRHGALCESFPADRQRTSRLTVLTKESQDIKNRFPPATTNLVNGSSKAGYRDDFSSSATERSNDKERWFVRRKADKFAADPIIDSSATAIRFHLASGCPSRTLIQQLYKRRVKRSPAAIDAFVFLSICSLIFNHSLLQIAISSFEARTNV